MGTRSEFKIIENNKKDLAEQIRFQEQKSSHDLERIKTLQSQLDEYSNEKVRNKKQGEEVSNLRNELENTKLQLTKSQLEAQQEVNKNKRAAEERIQEAEYKIDTAKKAHEKDKRELRTEFEIKNMELRQLQDKAAAYENENERFQKALLEAHQELANEKVKSETKDQW